MADDNLGSSGLVNDGWDITKAFAEDAFKVAIEFLEAMKDQTDNLSIPAINYDWDPLGTIPRAAIPTAPTSPTITALFPALPAGFSLGNIRDPSTIAAPVYDLTDPIVNLPAPPSPLAIGDVPLAPDVDTDFPYPDEPDFTLPTLPTLLDIVIPNAPTLDYPEFTAEAPDDSDLVVPGFTFSFEEIDYTDDCVLEAIQTKLCETLTVGGTGISSDVEQAIWDRERNREDQTVLRTKEEIRDSFASRGFELPSGAEYSALRQADQENQNKIISLGRDIAIKQAELEQENIKHAISEAIRLEDILIGLHNSQMQRAFDVAKYAQDVALLLFESQIKRYNTQVEFYKAAAVVYETLMRGELARLEGYKLEIDAQKLISDINSQTIQVYTAQVDALRATADFYRTTMEAVRIRLEAEKTKIDVFNGEIVGYTAQLDAKKTEYEIYTAQVDAEISKVKVFDSQVEAYVSRIQAYGAEVNASSKISEIDISKERLQLDAYLSSVEAALKEGELEATRVQTEGALYESQVRSYLGEVEGAKALQEADITIFSAGLEENKARASMALTQGQMEMQRIISTTELMTESIKGGALVSAEIASAALSAVNLSASVGSTYGQSTVNSFNHEV